MIDFNKTYLVPSVLKSKASIIKNNEIVECKIEPYKWGKGGINIIPLNTNYKTSFFLDTYFEWLIYRNYIKIKND